MPGISFQFNDPKKAKVTFALAHGAGAGMNTPFMEWIAEALADRGVRVARFEFPYMAARSAGKKRPPDKLPVLIETWQHVIDKLVPLQICPDRFLSLV